MLPPICNYNPKARPPRVSSTKVTLRYPFPKGWLNCQAKGKHHRCTFCVVAEYKLIFQGRTLIYRANGKPHTRKPPEAKACEFALTSPVMLVSDVKVVKEERGWMQCWCLHSRFLKHGYRRGLVRAKFISSYPNKGSGSSFSRVAITFVRSTCSALSRK